MKREVRRFDSSGVTMTSIFRTVKPVQMGRMDFQPKGVLGMHEATCDQLFIVVKGEMHESGTDTGMQVFIIEGDALKPEQFMKEISKYELF